MYRTPLICVIIIIIDTGHFKTSYQVPALLFQEILWFLIITTILRCLPDLVSLFLSPLPEELPSVSPNHDSMSLLYVPPSTSCFQDVLVPTSSFVTLHFRCGGTMLPCEVWKPCHQQLITVTFGSVSQIHVQHALHPSPGSCALILWSHRLKKSLTSSLSLIGKACP